MCPGNVRILLDKAKPFFRLIGYLQKEINETL